LGRRLGIALPENEVGGPEGSRGVELRRSRVDRGHGFGTDRDRRHDSREADTTATDDRDAVARPHPGRAPHCAEPRRDRAADEPGDLERHVWRDRHAGALGYDTRLREGGEERVVKDTL